MATFKRWKFANGFDAARRDRLTNIARFSSVIELAEKSINFIQVESCRGRDPELTACIQPVFTLSISAESFDAIFNSPVGYRGQHLLSPNRGLIANLELVGGLEDRLVEAATQSCIADLQSINLRTSIRAASCKVWIHEDDFPFHSLTVDLAVDTWVDAAAAGEEKAKWGLCAPRGNRIQIKGALLDPKGNEVVPLKKVLRRYEIHRFGFS